MATWIDQLQLGLHSVIEGPSILAIPLVVLGILLFFFILFRVPALKRRLSLPFLILILILIAGGGIAYFFYAPYSRIEKGISELPSYPPAKAYTNIRFYRNDLHFEVGGGEISYKVDPTIPISDIAHGYVTAYESADWRRNFFDRDSLSKFTFTKGATVVIYINCSGGTESKDGICHGNYWSIDLRYD